tara:strand:- start:172 stop:1500 length:1329 start_codon:yes stop_codon:yes gene_type:complete
MSKKNPKKIDAQAEKLLLLLSLQRQSRSQKMAAELAFMMVNETYRLVPYRQALLWTRDNGIETVSGLAELEKNSPYLLWLSDFIARHLPQQGEDAVRILTAKDAEGADKKNWQTWCSANAALMALYDRNGNVTGALWIDREEAFASLDKVLLDELADAYGYGMQALAQGGGKKLRGWKGKILALSVLAVLCWPVRLAVTAPAEIVAKDPYVISIPFDGTLADIPVEPNTLVKQGEVLAKIDDTALRSQVAEAEHRQIMAQAVLAKAERESITAPEKKQALAALRAEIALRQQELSYARELLAQSVMTAPRDGVAVFSDKNDLRGRPVRTGDKIMMLAAPHDTELLIRVPVDAMLTIDEAEPAAFFLNTAPLEKHQAYLKTVSYQSSMDADGLLTYKIRAAFDEGEAARIGLTGTAKLYGGRTLLAYSLFRRPLISLRRLLGV